MLEIKNLKKNFGDKKVLKDISVSVSQGEIVGIIGPSGCGKSTFLRCINFLEKPTSGKIIFENELIDSDKEITSLRRKVGMVFQQFNLFDNMTILDNLILAPVKLNIMKKNDAIKEARRLLKKIDLQDKEKNYPSELSGGQKQRIAIIRTLLMKPKMILFDEPTSALDPFSEERINKLIMQNVKNKAMIIIAHRLSTVVDADKIYLIRKGQITEEGTHQELMAKKGRYYEMFTTQTELYLKREKADE